MRATVKIEATSDQVSAPSGLYVRVDAEDTYESTWLANKDYPNKIVRTSDALRWAVDALKKTHNVEGTFAYDPVADEFFVEVVSKEKSVTLSNLTAALSNIGISEDLDEYTKIEIDLTSKPRIVLRGLYKKVIVYNVEE